MEQQEIKALFERFGRDSVEIIKANMRRADQVATGDTINALKYTATETSLVVSGPQYIWTLETGRKPYQDGPSGGFADRLLRWMRAKGIRPKREGQSLESAAKSLAWFINEYGSKLHRDGGRNDIITPIFKQERFDRLNQDVAQISASTFLKLIRNFTRNKN